MKKVKGYHIQNPIDLIATLCDKQPDLAKHFFGKYIHNHDTQVLCAVSIDIFNFVRQYGVPVLTTIDYVEKLQSMRLIVFCPSVEKKTWARKEAAHACAHGWLTSLRGLVAYYDVDLSLKSYGFFRKTTSDDIRLFLLRWRGSDDKRVHVADNDITYYFKCKEDHTNVDLVKLMIALLKKRPGINYDRSALTRMAAKHARPTVLKLALDSELFRLSKYALQFAIQNDRIRVVKYLLQCRWRKQERKHTALMLAIKYRKPKIIRMLLDDPHLDPTVSNYEAVAAILTYGDDMLREAIFQHPLVRKKLKL